MRVCAALVARAKGEAFQVLDVSLAEAALGVVSPHLSTLTHEGRDASEQGEFLTGLLPVYAVYRCATTSILLSVC